MVCSPTHASLSVEEIPDPVNVCPKAVPEPVTVKDAEALFVETCIVPVLCAYHPLKDI